jgi:hypothetical protein
LEAVVSAIGVAERQLDQFGSAVRWVHVSHDPHRGVEKRLQAAFTLDAAQRIGKARGK